MGKELRKMMMWSINSRYKGRYGMKKLLNALIMGMVIVIFAAGQAYSAPKGNNGKNNGKANNGNANNGKANNGNANNGNAQAAKANKGNNKAVAQKRGQAAVHKQQARRNNEANQKREARNRAEDRNPSLNKGNDDLAFNNRSNRANNERRDGAEMKKEKADRALDLIGSLNRARWSHNPHDTRGQGNMGKVDMLDPFGHDKDSDRKELYGNNGRPIRVDEEPEVVEDLPPKELALLDATIDFSSLYDMQWLLDWYNRVMANYDPDGPYYDYYQALWYDHFFPGGDLNTTTGIRLNNVWDSSDRYFYDLSLNSFEGDSLIVTTTMTLTEGYTSYSYYNLDGSLSGEYSEHQAGEVVYEQTEELSVDSTSDTFTVGITADSDLVDIAWGSDEVYVDLAVTVTDPSTGATYTQAYDQSLYLYRCPYGKITDERTGQAIVNAKITVHFEDGSIVALDKATNKTASNPQVTDATGRFGFILQTNRKYYLTAQAEGYEEYKSPIFTEQWHVLREDISLVSKQEALTLNVE
jgi:hypothetical protein